MDSITESLVDGLVTWDSKGTIISTNNVIKDIFGYSNSELIGRNISMLVSDDDKSTLHNFIVNHSKTVQGNPFGCGQNLKAKKKDGTLVDIFLTLNRLKIDNHYYFNGMVHDTQLQDTLEQELRLSSLTFQINEAIVITDEQNRIIRVNDAFTKITGYSFKEVKGKDPKILNSGKQNKQFYKKMWASLNETHFWEGELWNQHKNGEIYLQLARITAAVNNQGEISNYIATFSDITHIRQNEKRLLLKAKEDKTLDKLLHETLKTTLLKEYLQIALDTLIQKIPWLHVVNKGGIFLINYDSAEDVLDLFVEHNLGQQIIHSCSHVAFGSGSCGLAAQKKELQFASDIDHLAAPLKNRHSYGRYSIPILQSGEVLGVLVVYLPAGVKADSQKENFFKYVANILGVGIERRDANESLNAALFDAQMAKKELQSAMAEAETLRMKAEEATLAKSQFLASMSHEIRTPMNGVLGMTELLIQTSLTDEQTEFAMAVQNSGESLLSIINDILDFSKIEAGKLEIENIDFDLRDMLDHFIDMITFRAQSKGLQLSCFLEPQVKGWINGDPTRIRQILVNLAGNAVKFTHDGEIAIYGEEIPTEMGDDGRMIKFSVRDSGIGIPEEARGKLFQSFSQVDASTTRKYGGTGLGLAICKQLAGLMGGEINVESEPGRGSTFWFTIHLNPTESIPILQDYAQIDISGKRAFVVDNNKTSRMSIRSQLIGWGCSVKDCDSGQSALKILEKDNTAEYDFIILDQALQGMNGATLGRTIKSLPAYNRTPMIMLTTISLRKSTKKMQDIGLSGFLTKPIKYKNFKKCVQSVLVLPTSHSIEYKPTIAQDALSENERRSVNILLVEDNRINQKVALKMLEKLGIKADCANNGQEAIDFFWKKNYEIILMDCQMPIKDGFEATRDIRELSSTIDKPSIIAMTAFAMNGDREKCIDAGMDDYLSKPINQNELMKTIDKWIRKTKHPEPLLADMES